jgi:alpha-L-rhamnosidase
VAKIKGEYKRINNRLSQYKIELPANMVGEFNAGFSTEDVVTLNGKPVNLSFGSVRLEPGLNEIEIRVNSF